MTLEISQIDYAQVLDYENTPTATVACVLPAYNEEETIEQTLQSILNQTRPPEAVFVIVNNTTDDTFFIARDGFSGTHVKTYRDVEYTTEVLVLDIGKNAGKKVGALNKGWELAHGFDYILGVDGDTVLDPKCIQHLLAESEDDTRIGGISAIYSFDQHGKSLMEKFLISGQKQQFASFELDNLLRNRNMTVLGGQCSLLRVSALKEVMRLNRQSHPWVHDSSVEDSLLSLQIKSAGYSTKISARARAIVGAMDTTKSLHAQQVKWSSGAVELMKMRPFHPNLRLQWGENIQMAFNILTRVLFALLLIGSVSSGMFDFHPIWLLPPVISWMLSIRTLYSMKKRTTADAVYAWTFFPTEAYMMLRMIHFITAWHHVLTESEKDTWAAQAAAESGKGTSGVLWPLAGLTLVGVVFYYSWSVMDLTTQSVVLGIGWPVLGTIAVLLTLTMLRRLTRKHRGFTV